MTTITPNRSGNHRHRLDGPVFLTAWLFMRRHVDLLRLTGAMCRAR
ncbi:MAG: putative leader peptide [Pseudonocardiaceae bacterium]